MDQIFRRPCRQLFQSWWSLFRSYGWYSGGKPDFPKSNRSWWVWSGKEN